MSPAVAWERVGNAPEYDDELILEFGYATGKEVFVGYEYGESVPDKKIKEIRRQ